MDLQEVVKGLLESFAETNRCRIYPTKKDKRPFFFLDAVPGAMREGGPYSAGPTWMVLGVAGDGMDRDLLARAEMLIGEVDTAEGLAYAMQRHYIDTAPSYAVCPIERRWFLFMIQDRTLPLAVRQESMEARLGMELVMNMMGDAIPGINMHPDALKFAIEHHKPHSWNGAGIEFIDIAT